MSIPRTPAWGVGLAAVTALISGISIFVNGLIVKEFADPVALTGARNALVGLALLAALVGSGGVTEVRTLDRRRGLGLAAIAVIGGSVPFILFFSGLAAATGPGAAFIHKTLFIWVAALAAVILGERLGLAQILGLAALFAGVALVGPSGWPSTGEAEALILVATLLWSVEVIVVRRLVGIDGVSVRLAATARMALGAVLIAGFLAVSGRLGAIAAFTAWQWVLVVGTGVLLLGYVTSWYAALQRAPASLVTAVLVAGAVVTAVLTALRTGTLPSAPVGVGLALMATAVVTLIWVAVRARRDGGTATTGDRGHLAGEGRPA
jgi:drug/metabolite transporter (DMT)-like permease